MSEKPTTVRLKPETKTAVREFADTNGLTLNGALNLLLVEALAARTNRPGPPA